MPKVRGRGTYRGVLLARNGGERYLTEEGEGVGKCPNMFEFKKRFF